TVISVKVKEGETVIIGTMNNPGTVLFTVADLEHMQMDALFDESDIPDIKVGMKSRVVVDPLPDDTFKAVVTEVASAGKVVNIGTREEVVNFEVKADIIGDSKGIKNGMGGNIDIITKQKEDILKIPLTAIQKRLINGKFTKGVFLYKNGKALFKQVETGISGEDDIEVKDGLQEGDIIISGPYSKLRKLKDGDRVKLMKREKKHGTRKDRSARTKKAEGK
ncbi:MAG: HlyD family efflux transporter periplasmic adaptor subunit, partial [Proteobacteria bacterium]|nr:HlyD family efflux transporter periplasmic adaptor subunit [Pseudomonadota bacterium]